MSNFDLLKDLGVEVPEPTSLSVPRECKILRLREGPPRAPAAPAAVSPFPFATASTRSDGADASVSGAGVLFRDMPCPSCSPSRECRSCPDEVIIVDSSVPCNDCVNWAAAKARSRARSEQRHRDAAAVDEAEAAFDATFSRPPRCRSADEKRGLRDALSRARDEERDRKMSRRAAERTGLLDDGSFLVSETAARREMELRRAASQRLHEELQKQAADEKERRRESRARERQQQVVRLAAAEAEHAAREVHEHRTASDRKRQSDLLRTFWQGQISDRRQRQAEETRREKHDRETTAAAEEAAKRDGRYVTPIAPGLGASIPLGPYPRPRPVVDAVSARHQLIAELTAARRAREEAKAKERRAMAAAVAAEEAQWKALENETARVKASQRAAVDGALRAQIVANKVKRQDEQARRKAAAVAPVAKTRTTLYRCPASGRVLPPQCFNIPKNIWQGISTAALY